MAVAFNVFHYQISLDTLFTILMIIWTLKILPHNVDLANFGLRHYLIYDLTLARISDFILAFELDFVAMNEKKCCVLSCQRTRADNAVLHLFPHPVKELDRFNKWIYAIGGNVLVVDPQIVFKRCRVCHSHFDTKYYTTSKRLTNNAVPTLNLSGVHFTSRLALKEVTNTIKETTLETETIQITNPSMCEPVPSTSLQTLPLTSVSKGVHFTSRLALKEVTNTIKETTLETETIQITNPSMCEPVPSTSLQTLPLTSVSKGAPSITLKSFNGEHIILRKTIKKLQHQRDSAKKRLKKALKLSENRSFQKTLGKFSKTANIFTNLQFREVGKHRLGRRFTKEEKVMALALYKQGPRAYRWLNKFFVLPSPLTLSRMIGSASLHPGINENIFRQLEKRVAKMKSLEKLCILLFDEVALTAHFDYNKIQDCVSGFVNNGKETDNKIADHALVFMVRGIQKNYKQPIAYTFCSGTTPAAELSAQIKNILKKLKAIGLHVLCTVCDQGATNVSAINLLIKSTKENYLRVGEKFDKNIFEIDGDEYVPLFDPPHLIKGIRNNLITKNLKCVMYGEEKIAKWEHIINLYNEDAEYRGIRLMPKLTERHVDPKKMSKMKVKCATQVFSQSVAANMGYLARKGILPEECKHTADVILFFDNLFDSVNGSYNNYKNRSGKSLLGPVTPNSPHKKVWTDAKKILSTMTYTFKNKSAVVPSITNWLRTIENFEYIVDVLYKKYNLTSVWMRHFNQDPLENFFGCIRSHGYRNISPSCAGFDAAFASLLITNLSSSHSPGSNCEMDNCNTIKSLQDIFFNTTQTSSFTMEVDFNDVASDDIFVDLKIKMENLKIKAQLEYVTGYVLRKLQIKCDCCKTSLYSTNKDDSVISFREYDKNKSRLTYPSISLINLFSNIQDVVTRILQNDSKKKNIKQYIKTIFSVVIDYSFIKCNEHKSEIISKIEDLCINIFICNWCRNTNKILCGSRTDFNIQDRIQKLAFDYVKKRTK